MNIDPKVEPDNWQTADDFDYFNFCQQCGMDRGSCECTDDIDFDNFEDDTDYDISGSILESMLCQYQKGFCRTCTKPMEEKPANESWCSVECKLQWNKLKDARIIIGLHDLRTRGFD